VGIDIDSAFVVVRARNHVDAMSSAKAELISESPDYDFTTGLDQAYGIDPMVLLSDGPSGLFAADANGDGDVQALDFNAYLSQTLVGATGYATADFNYDGAVQALDFNLYLANTLRGASSQVP
jgi:hypothetical protein